MPKDFLELLFGPEYDPTLPNSTPKPPGYWAAQAVRGGPLTTAGIVPGMIGSGLEAVNENIAMRMGSLVGQALSSLPEAELKAAAGAPVNGIPGPLGLLTSLGLRNAGRLGQAARDVNPPPWGDPEVFKRSVSGEYGDVSAFENMSANMGLDPTLPFQFGPKIGATLAGKTGEVLGKGFNYPFEKAMEGVGAAGKWSKEMLETPRAGKWAFTQAPESMAAEKISALEDIGANMPQFLKHYSEKIESVGRYALPTFRSGAPNYRKASEDVAQKFEKMEGRVWNPVDPLQSLNNFASLIAARNSHQQRLGKLQTDLMRNVDPGDAESVATVRGAYNAWYDTTMRALDALDQSIPMPQIPRGAEAGAIPQPPAGAGAVHDAILAGMKDWHEEITKTRALVDKVRRESANNQVDPELASSIISDLYYERNQAIVESMKAWYKTAAQAIGAGGDEVLSKQFVEFGTRLPGLEVEAVGGPGGTGLLPTRLKSDLDETYGIFFPHVERAIGDRMRLIQHLKKGLTETRPIDPTTGLSWDLGGLWRLMGEHGATIPPLGEAKGEDLLRAATELSKTGAMRLDELRHIAHILDKWQSQGDLLMSKPFDLALGPTERGLVEAYSGGKTLFKQPTTGQQMKQAVGMLHRYVREGMVATPSYLMTNFIGGGLVNLFTKPEAAKAALDNFREMAPRYHYGLKNPGRINSIDMLPPDIRMEYQAWGDQAPPNELVSSFVAKNLEAVGNTKLAAERIHPALRFGYNALTAPLDPVNIATGGVGAAAYAAGMTVGEIPLRNWIRNFAQVSEASMRLGIAQWKIREAVVEQVPLFKQEVRDMIHRNPRMRKDVNIVMEAPQTPPGNAGGTAVGAAIDPDAEEILVKTVGQTPIPPTIDALETFASKVDEAGIYFSPQDVLKWANEVGMDIDDAKDLAQKWADHLDTAKQAGVNLANQRHIKYTHYNNAEKIIDTFVPFSRWAIHMVPNLMELVAGAPGVVMLSSTLNHITREEAQKAGLPNSYQRAAEAGELGTKLAEIVFGRQGGAGYIDPSRVINPYASAVSGASGARFSDSPVEALAQLSPLKPYPTIGLLGQLLGGAVQSYAPAAAGLLPIGNDTPLPTFSRYSGAMGVIPGQGGPELWQSLVKQLPFMEPYNYRQAEVQRRLGEMSVTDTGYPDHPNYTAARATANNPLNRTASGEVDNERGLEQFLGIMFPFGVQLLRPEERKALAARTNLPQGRRDTPEKIEKYEQALDANPWAGAHLGAQGSELATHAQYVFNVFRNPATLFPDANPEVATRLSRDLANYDAAPTTDSKNSIKQMNPLVGFALQRRALFIQNDPVAGAYIQWRQTVHPQERGENEEALLPQFIQWYLMRESKQVKK